MSEQSCLFHRDEEGKVWWPGRAQQELADRVRSRLAARSSGQVAVQNAVAVEQPEHAAALRPPLHTSRTINSIIHNAGGVENVDRARFEHLLNAGQGQEMQRSDEL